MEHHLAVYLPQDRYHSLLQGQPLPERQRGSVLCADISGFTPLTETLLRVFGPQRGAEELTRQVNLVYEELISEVEHCGGSVIGFAGDSITCWFSNDPPSENLIIEDLFQPEPATLQPSPPSLFTPHLSTILRALACAQAMQQAMQQFVALPMPTGQAIPLAIKVAIASGPVRRFVVGDSAIQYLDVLVGQPTNRMMIAEKLARAGEVLLDEQSVAVLGNTLPVAGWRADPASTQRFAVLTANELRALHPRLPSRPQPAAISPVPPTLPPAPSNFHHSPLDLQLRPWLLPAIYERLQAGYGDFVADLRPAVALFVRFGGLDYEGDEAAGQKLDHYVRWVQKILAAYEGTLIDLDGAEPGRLLAVFGAPVAHEDDAVRAILAAVALRQPPATLPWVSSIRIAISYGTLRAGISGSTSRRIYSALGDEVNVAARLLEHTEPGQIIVSGRIRAATNQRFRWHPLPPLLVKGKSEPIPIFQLLEADHPQRVGETPAPGQPPECLGREAELALIDTLLLKLRRQAAAIASPDQLTEPAAATALVSLHATTTAPARPGCEALLIEGEPGIGKSSLVAALNAQATTLALRTLSGHCTTIEQTTAYRAWCPIFEQLLGLDHLRDPASQRERLLSRVESLVGTSQLDCLPLLSPVLPFAIPDNPLTAQMTEQVRADNTLALLVALLHSASRETPTVLILEDAHWLDSASWSLVLALAQPHLHESPREQPSEQQPNALLLVLTARPLAEPVPGEYSQLRQLPGLHHLSLQPLAPDAALRLVCRRLGVASLPPSIADLIQRKAEGHPFFSEELAYALRDTGIITIADGHCDLAPQVDLSAISFPDTIQGIIISRIDRLAPAQQLTLKVASIIGRAFAFRVLRDIYPVEADKPQLPTHLEYLARLDLTLLQAPDPELTYLFKHIITQEVAYNLLLFAQRQPLHRLVAEWYERTYGDDLSPYYPILAHHWQQAADPLRALHYLDKAGEQAIERFANREAITFFSQALQLSAEYKVPGAESFTAPSALSSASVSLRDQHVPPSPSLRLARWQHQLGRAHYRLGQHAEARAHLERALALFGSPVPTTQGRLAVGFLGQVLRQCHKRLSPAWLKRPSLLSHRQSANPASPTPAGLPPPPATPPDAAKAALMLAALANLANQPSLLLYSGLLALNLAEDAGGTAELAQASANICPVALILPSIAAAYERRAHALIPSVTDFPTLIASQMSLSFYYFCLGRWPEAHAAIDETINRASQIGDWRRWEEATMLKGTMAYAQADFAQGIELCAAAYTSAAQRGDTQEQAITLLSQALCLLPTCPLDQTISVLRQALDLMQTHRSILIEIRTYAILALAHLYQGNLQEARQATEAAMALIAESGAAGVYSSGNYGIINVYLALWENPGPWQSERADFARQSRAACTAAGRAARLVPLTQAHALRFQALADWLDGKHARARRGWLKSLAATQQFGLPYERALTHYEIGRHASGAERQEHLTQAATLFQQLGATHDLARTAAAAQKDEYAPTG
jgi:class 3 adenylate cyclase/tetratricopeptide (TPR) repeat protein